MANKDKFNSTKFNSKKFNSTKYYSCHSPTQPNSSQVGVTRFLVCNPPPTPPHPPHQTNSVLLLFKSAVSRELELYTEKSYKIEFGPKNFRPIFFYPKNFRPNFFNQKTKKVWCNLPRSAGVWSLFKPATCG